jgi:hypothetical protein
MDRRGLVPRTVPQNMQLANFPSIPGVQPVAAYTPPETDASSTLPSGGSDTPFAQLLPAPSTPGAGKPSAPADKKPDTSKPAKDDQAVPLYYGWLTDMAPQNLPAAATPKASEPAGVAAALTASGQPLALAAGIAAGAGNISAGKNGTPSFPLPAAGKGAETPPAKVPAAPASASAPAVPAPAPRVSGAPITATLPGKASSPVPWSAQGSASALTASQPDEDAAKTVAPGATTAADAMNLIKAGGHGGATGFGSAEKIAGQGSNDGGAPAGASKATDKKILSSDAKQVTDTDPSVGIGVAKVAPAMPTSAQTDRQPNVMMASAPVPTVSASSNAGQADAQGAVSQQGVAQRAVDAAISAAESVSSGSHQAVNMQFSVGNADLSLRVELRNGEIHTTFRTDSADLRLDLAHEWQSSNPGSGNGSVRLAEPVFTSSTSPNSMATGENASQQRGGQGRSESSQAPAGGMFSNASAASSSAESEAPARTPVLHSTSLHLQAFA